MTIFTQTFFLLLAVFGEMALAQQLFYVPSRPTTGWLADTSGVPMYKHPLVPGPGATKEFVNRLWDRLEEDEKHNVSTWCHSHPTKVSSVCSGLDAFHLVHDAVSSVVEDHSGKPWRWRWVVGYVEPEELD